MLPPPLSSLFPYTTLFRSDYYVGLRQRTRIAREQKADFFVSIHADAFTSPRPNGSSVYALSQRGATSETAQWLAASENQADLIGGVDGNLSLDDKDEEIGRATCRQSERLLV